MKRIVSHIVLSLGLLMLADSALAWTWIGSSFVSPLRAKSFTSANSPANDAADTLFVSATLAVTGGGSVTDTGECFRNGVLDDYTCTAQVIEEPPSDGCEYCGNGLARAEFPSGPPESFTWGPFCDTYNAPGSGGK